MGDFKFAGVWTVVSLILGSIVSVYMGPVAGVSLVGGILAGLLTTSSLGVTETSLSLDNAVINAPNIKKLDPFWLNNYMLFGMPIATIGMRFAFPILIVSLTSGLGVFEVLSLAIHNPDQYAKSLDTSKYLIIGFGTAFLSLLCCDFFVDSEKDEHWFSWLEDRLSDLGYFPGIKYVIVVTILLFSGVLANNDMFTALKFIGAGFAGIISYSVIKMISSYAEGKSETGTASGWVQFLRIELIDACFSFDGVIGGFAITQNIFLIALGLGIGAVWVRTFSKRLAQSEQFAELPFIEHGAFWNIVVLVALMNIGMVVHLPEWLGGLFAVLIIGGAYFHSKKALKS